MYLQGLIKPGSKAEESTGIAGLFLRTWDTSPSRELFIVPGTVYNNPCRNPYRNAEDKVDLIFFR